MDVTELVREFRAEVPGPDDAARDRARSALAAAIEAERADGGRSGAAAGRARRGGGEARPSGGGARVWGRPAPGALVPRARPGLAAVAAAAVAAAVGIGLAAGGLAPGGGTERPGPARSGIPGPTVPGSVGPDTATVTTLRAAAAASRRQVVDPPATYWFSQERDLRGGGPDSFTWDSATRPGLYVNGDQRIVNAPAPRIEVGATMLTWTQLERLPTDPAALDGVLRPAQPDGLGPTDQHVFEGARTLLGWEPVPPAVRGALYQVIARLPEVRVLGPATDPLGRRGTVIGFQEPGGGVRALLIDPGTGKVLAVGADDSRVVITGPHPGHARITYTELFIASGFVAHLGDRP